jgi:hypothetical protein
LTGWPLPAEDAGFEGVTPIRPLLLLVVGLFVVWFSVLFVLLNVLLLELFVVLG